MKCPFCAEEVKDDAVVCKHCRHDLTVVRALIARVGELTKQVAGIQGGPGITAPTRPSAQPSGAQSSGAQPSGAHDRAGVIAGAVERRVPLISPATTLLLALAALLLAHFLIIVHYDLSLIWLR